MNKTNVSPQIIPPATGLTGPDAASLHNQIARRPIPPQRLTAALAGRLTIAAPLLALLLTLAGCQLLSLVGGKGNTGALYKLPPKSRVLVFVNRRDTAAATLDIPLLLGKKLNEQLYEFKAAENFVDQSRVMELRRDPRIDQMGIADLAAATQADVVIYVDLLQFNVQTISDGQVIQGTATATAKVVDKNGKRLWPPETDALGYEVTTQIPPALIDQSSPIAMRDKVLEDVNVRVGRLFHDYSNEDKEMARD